MIRFVHTADWQLGLKLRHLPGDRGARVRAERVEAVRRIAALAHDRRAHAVVVAGDVFDDDAVGPHTVAAARDALAAFAPIPVLLLPGNHDPAGPGSVFTRLGAPSHVRPLLTDAPVDLGAARFHPCPLTSRHPTADPTEHLPARAPGDAIRVAIAHGPALDFGTGSPGRIDVARVVSRGFDYVALGDWHGTAAIGPRAWYSGTPEPTKFSETRPGNALVVEIDAPGEPPRVEVVPVARTRWVTRRWTFASEADVKGLAAWLHALPARSDTLVDLVLDGALSLQARAALDALLDAESETLLHLRHDAAAVIDAPDPEDLDVLTADGFVGAAVTALRADPSPTARDALRLLHRLLASAS